MSDKSIMTQRKLDKWEESYLFIKGYALAKKMENTLIALSVAIQKHEGQFRKGGEPYIIHPLTVTAYLINLDIDDDIICAAALLHDVVEDCDLPNNGEEFTELYHLDPEVLEIVLLLTKEKGYDEKEYYKKIKSNEKALIIKLSDRANNLSTLSAFSFKKMEKYVLETQNFIFPLCKHGKDYYPHLSNAITIIKYQLVSVCETIKSLLNMKETDEIDFSLYRKTFLFIRGYAKGKKMMNTLIALALAEIYHRDQLRQTGDPFIIHPLRVCSYLISLGIDDDATCAAALLHEILKKCHLPNKGFEIVEKYGISQEVLDLIHLVSKDPKLSKEVYYDNLTTNCKALLIKLSNRAHTCTTLVSCTKEEKEEYLDENLNFIFQLGRYAKSYYPKYSDEVINMEFHINSVTEIIKYFIKVQENEIETETKKETKTVSELEYKLLTVPPK